jgi:death-on-curing protein
LLCHLDKNDYTFDERMSHVELYDFMIKVASHSFADKKLPTSEQCDDEVEKMTRWIRKNVRRIERGERIVTFRELKGILSGYNFELENLEGNSVDLVTYEMEKSWFGKSKRMRNRIARIGYPGDGQVVGKNDLRSIRKLCRLTENAGIDSYSFYRNSRPPDYFVSYYRGTLKKLART